VRRLILIIELGAEVTIDFEEASGITRELRQEGVAGQEAVVQRQTDNIQRVLEVAAQQPVNQVVGESKTLLHT
jgi:hypothetical protein